MDRAAADRTLGIAYVQRRIATLTSALVVLWVFAGGFVLFEPSPYELFFVLAFGAALAGGLHLHRQTLGLLYVTLFFVPFSLIAVFQVRYMAVSDALLFTLVTIFLLITSYFVANYVAQAPLARMRLITRAYVASALITALVGTLAYLGVLPGEDVFLLFGRAKAFFKDPNVYGPFLVLPALFMLQRVLLGTAREALWGGLIYLILFVGVFVSFSRGAWAHLFVSSGLVFLLCFFLEARAQEKVRLMLLAIGGIMAMAAVLVVLLSIDSIADLFLQRFALTQDYDSGETGRFGRIGYALDLALTQPWGLGPLEFSFLRIVEQPHNTYINVLLAYGWGGGLAYYLLVGGTLWRGMLALAQPSPNRLLMIPVFSAFVPLAALSGIIDTDHWRHWFLIVGLVWGISAGYRVVDPCQTGAQRQQA